MVLGRSSSERRLSMKKLLVGLAAVPFLAGIAMAGQPTPLSDAQMDKVTAGAWEGEVFNGAVQILELTHSTTGIAVEFPTLPGHVEDPAAAGEYGVVYQSSPCCSVALGS
jgi:hypothetical protein